MSLVKSYLQRSNVLHLRRATDLAVDALRKQIKKNKEKKIRNG